MHTPKAKMYPPLDFRHRTSICFDPISNRPPSIQTVAEVPRVCLNEVNLEAAVFLQIQLPRSLFTNKGTRDINQGRPLEISNGEHKRRKGVYMEYLGNKHRLLLLKEDKGIHIDLTVNLKSVNFFVKCNGGQWPLWEDLQVANIAAAHEQEELGHEASLGTRLVNIQNGISVNSGWIGEPALLHADPHHEFHPNIKKAMENLDKLE